MLRRRPALRFTLLLAGGILLAETHAIPTHWLVIGLAACFIIALFLNYRTPNALLNSIVLQVVVVLLGMALSRADQEHSANRRLSARLEGDTLTVHGILEDAPAVQGKSVRMSISGFRIEYGQVFDSLGRRLVLLASAKKFGGLSSDWKAGQTVVFRATLGDYPRPRNPREFDYGKYLALNDVDGILWLVDTLSAPAAPGKWRPDIWFSGQRAVFGKILDRLHGSVQAGFLRGVLFGDRTEIATDLKESFVNTGTIHILAVSGSNVAVIALALYMILGMFRIPKLYIVTVTIVGLLYYMMVTGAASSIVRATIMGCVFLVTQVLERKSDIFNSISLAAMIILIFSPSQLFDVGFQLSFAAVLSIVVLYPKLNSLIKKIPPRFEEIKGVDYVLKLFAVSLAAQLGTLPFTAYYFERLSIVSLAANLVVVPVVGINLVLGCLTLVTSGISEWIAATYAGLNNVVVSFLLGFVRAAASVPYAVVETAGYSLTGGVVFYLLLAGVFNPGHRGVRKAVVMGLLLVGSVSLWSSVIDSGVLLRITVLDVGQGDAILVEFPNKKTMLIDAGPKTPGFDAGERTVVPYLKRHEIGRIDLLVVSHPHSDHIGGMCGLLSKMDVGEFLEADSATASQLHRSVRLAAESTTILRHIEAGEEVSPDPSVRVYCVSPSSITPHANLNDRSVILRIVYGQTSIILPGDAEIGAEEQVSLQFGSFLDSDILKAGHHGSATSSSAQFLDGITPNFAIISVGKRNKFNHPSPGVLEKLRRRNIGVGRTDAEGAIIVESDGLGWKQRNWSNQE